MIKNIWVPKEMMDEFNHDFVSLMISVPNLFLTLSWLNNPQPNQPSTMMNMFTMLKLIGLQLKFGNTSLQNVS
jgi:hypothetical protein